MQLNTQQGTTKALGTKGLSNADQANYTLS